MTGDHGVVSVWDIGDDEDRRTRFSEFAWECGVLIVMAFVLLCRPLYKRNCRKRTALHK